MDMFLGIYIFLGVCGLFKGCFLLSDLHDFNNYCFMNNSTACQLLHMDHMTNCLLMLRTEFFLFFCFFFFVVVFVLF